MHSLFKLTFAIFLYTSLLTGCSLFHPHKIDIPQGNVIEQESVDKLKIGMNKEQVLFLMGTPVLTNPFNSKRWDYLYMMRTGEGEVERRQITLYFKGNTLNKITGEIKPPKEKEDS